MENPQICSAIAESDEILGELCACLGRDDWKGLAGSNLVRIFNALLNTKVSEVFN